LGRWIRLPLAECQCWRNEEEEDNPTFHAGKDTPMPLRWQTQRGRLISPQLLPLIRSGRALGIVPVR
jgi:hypothetical protein